jgi:predicted RNA-binding Zn ribbon-like protein
MRFNSVAMSRESKKFKVPDRLANLYDFANSLDLRRFVRHGVQHVPKDELGDPTELAAWMTRHGLLSADSRVTAAMFDRAIQLRSGIRAYLACGPRERASNKEAVRSLNAAMRSFPLVVKVADQKGAKLRACREDALSGLSVIVAELYDGAGEGTLDRMKMCAADECRRVFFDRSKPATRRWCMSTLCGNRMKTRTYRARHSRSGQVR